MKSYTHFTLSERNCLQQFLSEGKGVREIGRLMGRSASSISREIKRNCKDKKRYNAWWATSLYIYRRKKCVRKHVIRPDTKLYIYILECFKRFWSPEIIAHKCKQQGFSVCCASIYRALKENRLQGLSRKTALRRKKVYRQSQEMQYNSPGSHYSRQTGNCRNKIPYRRF